MRNKVSFVLLAHEKPNLLRDLIISIISTGCDVFLHHDLNSPYDIKVESEEWGLHLHPGKLYHADRVRVAWGEWSIVQATLNCLRLAQRHNYNNAARLMLISGSCMPIKPLYTLNEFLASSNFDFIEAVNARENKWVAGGIQNSRWNKFHFFNYRFEKRRFDLSLNIQSKIGIVRKLPLNHTPHIGSQWWCLRCSSIEKVLSVLEKNPKIEKFYKYTCIPDEHFFQTLIANLIDHDEISSKPLTKYNFNSWGVPRVYYNDDYSELFFDDEFFFARKISHSARELRRSLKELSSMDSYSHNKFKEEHINNIEENYKKKLALENEKEKNNWNSLFHSDTDDISYLKRIPNYLYINIPSPSGSLEQENTISNEDLIYNNKSTNATEWIRKLGVFCQENGTNRNVYINLTLPQVSFLEKLKWSKRVTFIITNPNALLEKLDEKEYSNLIKNLFTENKFSKVIVTDKSFTHSSNEKNKNKKNNKKHPVNIHSSSNYVKARDKIKEEINEDSFFIGDIKHYNTSEFLEILSKTEKDIHIHSHPEDLPELFKDQKIKYNVQYINTTHETKETSISHYKNLVEERRATQVFQKNIHWTNVELKNTPPIKHTRDNNVE